MPYDYLCGSRTFATKGSSAFTKPAADAAVRPDLVEKVEDILHAMEQARRIEQIALFPGWRLHPLKGNRAGEWSVWVTKNHRLTFRVAGEDIRDIDLEDYHGK